MVAQGGAWIYNKCEQFDESPLWDCYKGEWGASRDDFEYEDLYFETWNTEEFWECGYHSECGDNACADYWRGYEDSDDKWIWGSACVEWWECDNTFTNQGEWVYVDCPSDEDRERKAGAFRTAFSLVAATLAIAYAM